MAGLSRGRAWLVALLLGLTALGGLVVVKQRGLSEGRAAAEEKWVPPASSADLERWYETLADDGRGYQEWLDAAELITRPRDEVHEVDERGIESVYHKRKKGDPPAPALGEPLRQRTPAVSDLLEQRITSLYSSSNGSHQRSAIFVARLLARWDARAALPVLQTLTRDLPQKFAADKPGDRRYWVTLAFEFADEREKLGDLAAYGEVSRWIETLSPAAAGAEGVCWELNARRKRPEVLALSRRWFEAKRGELSVLADVSELGGMVSEYTLVLPGLREYVLARLDDQSAHGAIEIEAEGMIWRRSGDMRTSYELPAGARPPKGGFTLRVCDQYAIDLSRIEGAPKFEAWGSASERDAQIKTLRGWVETQPLRDPR